MPDLASIAQQLWSGDLHLVFQNTGYKLPAYCNRGGAVQGSRIYFPKLAPLTGTGQAANAVGAALTFVGGDHSQVYADMTDRFATPLALRPIDLEKVVTNTDYRQAYAQNQNAQLGRYADDQIVAAWTSGKNAAVLGPGSAVALTMGHIDKLREAFDLAEVPDDGKRVAFIHPGVWSQLLKFKEFSNADYIGPDNMPYKGGGMSGKFWQSFNWVVFNRVTIGAGNVARCMAWHPSCMGHGVNSPPTTMITQENILGGQYAVVTQQSMGAVVIDNTGVYEFAVDLDLAPVV